jgi:hypothetical protein
LGSLYPLTEIPESLTSAWWSPKMAGGPAFLSHPMGWTVSILPYRRLCHLVDSEPTGWKSLPYRKPRFGESQISPNRIDLDIL